MKGIYILILRMKESKDIRVGKLGMLHFKRGYYSYVGSAQGSGGDKRIRRHFDVAYGKNTTRRWHIDYFLPQSELVCAVFSPTDEDLECVIARNVSKYSEPLQGFGCSDCHCASHLFFSGKNTLDEVSDICEGVSGNESIIIYPDM
ncbi:MAG: GIY-YIG nuclease family protein [Candidatus Methanoperedens sp.]|nr:GIY-YIG nuclease family protein [Candidatus Methanoperedens sp.]